MTNYREEFLNLALSCGAELTRKPDGSEAITVSFPIEAWRKFDLAQQPVQQPAAVGEKLIAADGAYADAVQDIAHALAHELEDATLDRNDLVTVNRAKLELITKRVLEKARTAPELSAGVERQAYDALLLERDEYKRRAEAAEAVAGQEPIGYVVRHDASGGNFFSGTSSYAGMRGTYGDRCSLVFTAPVPAAGVQGTTASEYRNEGYDVVCDRRDLFDFLRAAWREGQEHGGEMDESERWSKATDHAAKAINGWATLLHVPQSATAQPDSGRDAALDLSGLTQYGAAYLKVFRDDAMYFKADDVRALALAAHPAPSSDAALVLLQDAARAWNNERESELDSIMERIEIFLIQQRAAHPANGALAGLTDEEIDAVWEGLDGRAIIQGESQINWNRSLRRALVRGAILAAAKKGG